MITELLFILLIASTSSSYVKSQDDPIKTNKKTSNLTLPLYVPKNNSNSDLGEGSAKRKCCQTLHDVYIIQNSESMSSDGTSTKADDYLHYHYGEGDYVTIMHFGGMWNGAVDGYYYSVNHVFQPTSYQGGSYHGTTSYDAALKGAINVLSKFNPERTRINLFSQGILTLEDRTLISKFLDMKAKFQKKTGCQVNFRCLWSYQKAYDDPAHWDDVKPFKDMCQQMGATPGLGIMNL